MTFSVLPVEEADIPRVVDIFSDGLVLGGVRAYVKAVFPGVGTPEGTISARSRYGQLLAHLPRLSGFLKVIDDADGSTVATSIYLYSPEPPKELPGLPKDGWKTEDDRDHAHHLRRKRNEMLLRIFGTLQGPVVEVLAFFVDPARHRQHIGALLMQHIIGVSKSEGAELVLVANAAAVPFYEKQGFRVVEDRDLDVPEKWQHKPRARIVSMIYKDYPNGLSRP